MSKRTCPNCDSEQVVTTYEQLVDANSYEHYCHSVKPHDANSKATCLACGWKGKREDLGGSDE